MRVACRAIMMLYKPLYMTTLDPTNHSSLHSMMHAYGRPIIFIFKQIGIFALFFHCSIFQQIGMPAYCFLQNVWGMPSPFTSCIEILLHL